MGVIVSAPGMRGRDPFTKLLLTGETFADESKSAHTVANMATVSLASAAEHGLPAGFARAFKYNLPAANQYLCVPPSSDFDFGTQDFTIDWWENRLNYSSSYGVFSLGAAQFSRLFCWAAGGQITLYASTNGASWDTVSGLVVGSVVYGVPTHYAIVRRNGTLYGYKNGVQVSSLQANVPLGSATDTLYVGRTWSSDYFCGYLANFRVKKGFACWVKPFTPPQTAS